MSGVARHARGAGLGWQLLNYAQIQLAAEECASAFWRFVPLTGLPNVYTHDWAGWSVDDEVITTLPARGARMPY